MTGLAIGGTFACGLLLLLQFAFPRRISLADAIAPYIGGPSKQIPRLFDLIYLKARELLAGEPWAPWATDSQILRWLRQADSEIDLAAVRRSQVITSGLAMLSSIVWLLLRQSAGKGVNPLSGLFIVIAAFIAGGWFRQWQINELAKNRISLIERQLPAVLDLLAFAVAAGEPVLLALRRISNTCQGPFVDELRRMVNSVNSGEGLVVALEQLHLDLSSQAVSRAAHALSVALERGTPLAQVLRAQAVDARAHEVRMLLVLAGKKETAMMLPVVFLILPMIVAVALYPGLIALQVL
jgi:tight adherence protein C